jgi:hypothetical protein
LIAHFLLLVFGRLEIRDWRLMHDIISNLQSPVSNLNKKTPTPLTIVRDESV